MNILDALDDPELFAPHFRGGTWAAWRAFLAALFALPMDADALALYRAHTGRTEPPVAPFKEAALIIGRRGGKSRVLATVAVFLAAFRDYGPFLAPGEVATVAVLASDRRQARTIFRYASGLLAAVPLLAPTVKDETADTITLTNRVVIEIGTASMRSTRGYSYAAVLCDEIAYWRDDTSANPDEEIVGAVRPGLATIPSAVLLLASNPYRKAGVLYTTRTRHYGRDDARVLVWQAPTRVMNPSLDPSIEAEAYEDDPEKAASEYGAEFRSDLSDFVPRDIVLACTPPGLFEIPPIAANRYVAFVDPAGGSGSDSMTLAIAHMEGDRVILDCIREQRPPFSPESVVADFAAVMKTYRVNKVLGDRWGGEFVREPFRKLGITYELSEKSKSEIYLNCLPLLNAGTAQLLALPRLTAQLCGLERRTARGGRDNIDHAPNAHDDLANVACGALLAAKTERPRVRFTDADIAMLHVSSW